jgi:Cu/Ag efflux pump CusA
MEAYLSGAVATTVQEGIRNTNVRVWVPPRYRSSIQDVRRMSIEAPDGHKVPLSRVADVTLVTGQPEITRNNLKTMVAVTARIEGRDLGSTVRDVRQILETPGQFPQDAY